MRLTGIVMVWGDVEENAAVVCFKVLFEYWRGGLNETMCVTTLLVLLSVLLLVLESSLYNILHSVNCDVSF